MENSGRIFFEDDETPRWYVAVGTQWVGPMTASDIYEKILAQELTWAHYVWKKGQSEWKRVCDVKTFQAAVPSQPAQSVQKEVKQILEPEVRQAGARKSSSQKASPPPAPQKSSTEVRIWYLYYNDSQFGPFSQDEIQRFLRIGKIHSRVHAWREGMKNWDKLENLQEFKIEKGVTPRLPQKKQAQVSAIQTSTQKSEQRAFPRRPLVAKILMSDEQSVIVGVCRDISIGGLQVLIEKVPAPVGARLKMNISPSSNDSGQYIEPFVAEGIIVRILEDGRGFSFRFNKLSDQARQSIESYIESPN